MRFGILGAARIAPAALIRPAKGHPEAVVVTVGARDPARAAAFAGRHGVPRVAHDYASVLADPEVDAVYVPLPNSLHAEWTLEALRAGKHVLCEKPLTANAAEAATVAGASQEALERSGLVVAEAFHYRTHPFVRRLREIVASGELGRVRRIESWLCAPIPRRGDIRYSWPLAGGAMMDMGCYAVNLVRLLAGAEPNVVSARALHRSPDVDRAMSAELEFPDGVSAAVHCSMWSHSVLHLTTRIRGDDGELTAFNPFAPHLFGRLAVRSAHATRRERASRRPTYAYQLDAFCDAVLRGRPLPTPADDAVANMTVIDAVYRAASMRPRGA